MNRTKVWLAWVMLLITAGCASEQQMIETPGEHTLGKSEPQLAPISKEVEASSETDIDVSISDTLSMDEALSKALLENPTLQSYAWRVRVQEAQRIQVALLPNPKLEAEMENFGGSGPFEGLGGREINIRLAQKVLLGSDRRKAQQLAKLNRDLAGWDFEIQRLEVLTGVTNAYTSALEAQQQWHQQQELVRVAENLYKSITAQVAAGKVSQLEATKAKVELSKARIDLKNARDRFASARSNLASYWGSEEPAFQTLTGTLTLPETEPPSYSELSDYIQKNPDVARWMTELNQRQAALDLERAKGIPDVTFKGGYKRTEELDAHAAMVGVSIPLKLFDRNQGNIKAARYQVNQARQERTAAVTEAYRSLYEAYQQMQTAYFEVHQLQEEVLPGAQTAFEAAQKGYRLGKFDYLEVLDAQRTLFSSRTRYIQALAHYHRSVADVERLTGTSLSKMMTN
jgi:cobalt-zinc-cadmium efflux system outer membrane protein